jgi:CDP-2,3-bis-(O-geranylgeranyl)-sn-glycerol synthase
MLDHGLHLVAILLLLGVANGTPIFAKRLFGERFAAPLDGGCKFLDKRPLLGPAKTIRGLVLAILATALAAPLLGFDWMIGAGLAAAAMLGDLLSSFVKRRLALKPHSQALGLDQIPESLLPLVLLRDTLDLGLPDMLVIVVLFLVLELLLSRLLYRLHLRDRPY